MKNVLLDQGLAPKAAILLREWGWDAVHVCEAGLECADDLSILEYARLHGMACIPLDHDFHVRLATTFAGGPSVILIRAERLNAQREVELIRSVWRTCESDIAEGAVVSTDGLSVRFRRLPLK